MRRPGPFAVLIGVGLALAATSGWVDGAGRPALAPGWRVVQNLGSNAGATDISATAQSNAWAAGRDLHTLVRARIGIAVRRAMERACLAHDCRAQALHWPAVSDVGNSRGQRCMGQEGARRGHAFQQRRYRVFAVRADLERP